MSDPAATPVPASVVVTDGLEASLDIAIFPEALPADCGENTTVKLVLCPAAIVTGKLNPVTLNPGPVAVTWLTVTLEPPVLVRVSDNPCDLPTVVLLKVIDGDAVNWPALPAMPVTGMVKDSSAVRGVPAARWPATEIAR